MRNGCESRQNMYAGKDNLLFKIIGLKSCIPFLITIMAIFSFWGCVADSMDEDGNLPTFTFNVIEPGIVINSAQACPAEGLTNNFDTVFLSLPANRTFKFLYVMTDKGGMKLMDFVTHDSTFINFEILTPNETFIFTAESGNSKIARVVNNSEPKTSLSISGKLNTLDVSSRNSFIFQGWDLADNHIFHTLTVIVEPDIRPKVFYEGVCR